MTTVLEAAEYRAEIDRAGQEFAQLVAELDPATPVPSCPGWDVAELVSHLGGVHYWAAAIVRGSGPKVDTPAAEGDLSRWYLAQLDRLRASFDDVDGAAPAWTLVGPGIADFWTRRQAHETAMHLCDVQQAAGLDASYAAALAADAVTEVLDVMAPRRHRRAPVPVPGPVAFVAPDGDHRWTLTPSDQPDLVDYQYGAAAEPDCVVTAPAESIALGLWRRVPIDAWQIRGDRDRVARLVDAPLTP